MPHFDRGVYEPDEDARVFDGSDDDEDIEGSRLPILIVLALMVLMMFAGVVWLAYTQGVARGRTETPVITAEAGPARVAPQNPGGAQQPYQGFKIYEQPAPPDDETGDSKPQVPVAAPAPAAKATAAEPAPKAVVTEPPVKQALPQPAPKQALTVSTPPPLPKPAKTVVAEAAKPVAKPAPAPVQVGPATAPPRALSPAAPKPAPAAPVAPTTAGSGAYVLQIGAYKSEADAEAAWKTYKAKHAALLADSISNVQQADLGDKGTWYRLRITGFASKDVASALCDRLKADGGGCFLGK